MPEVYTCLCGHQSWTIYSSARIECNKCGVVYQIGLTSTDFNADREQYDTRPRLSKPEEYEAQNG